MTTSTRTLFLTGALAVLALALVGCPPVNGDGDGENDPNYKPNKSVFEELRNQYAREPVSQGTGGDVEAIGHSANTTDQPLAESLVLNDANTLAARTVTDVQIRDRHPEAAAFFRENTGIVKRFLRPILELGERAWHQRPVGRDDETGETIFRYDMYGRYRLPGHRLSRVVEELIDVWKKYTQYPDPQDLEFPVVLTGLDRSLTYEQKVNMVARAMQQVVDELEFRGEVVALDVTNSDMSAEQLADRKQRLIAQIPQGGDIEIAFTFEYVGPRRLESIQLFSTRQRALEPMPVVQHPRSVGGRYRYSIPVNSHWIRKGENVIAVKIKEAGGRTFQQEYDLSGRWEYTDNNVGLIEIRDFQGYLSTLTKRLSQSIRLPGENERVVELTFFEPKVTVTGRPGAGSAGSGVRLRFLIGVSRPSLESVWYLPHDVQPDGATLTNAESVNNLPWEVCWERIDPEGRYGSEDAIEIEGVENQRRIYVKVEYNAGRDFDVLLFDFTNRSLETPLRQAEKVFSTTWEDGNSSFDGDNR